MFRWQPRCRLQRLLENAGKAYANPRALSIGGRQSIMAAALRSSAMLDSTRSTKEFAAKEELYRIPRACKIELTLR
jgi:hypothetical protein